MIRCARCGLAAEAATHTCPRCAAVLATPGFAPPGYAPPDTERLASAPPGDAPPGPERPGFAPPGFAPPGFEPPASGPPASGPLASGPPGSGPPLSGNPGYAPPAYGPPPYGPPGYGPPGYGPPGYGPPAYGPPGSGPTVGPGGVVPPPRHTTRRALVVAGVAVVLALVLVGVVARSGARSPRSLTFDPAPTGATSYARGRPLIGNGHVFFIAEGALVARDLVREVDAWSVPLPCLGADWAEIVRSTAANPLLLRCGEQLHAIDWADGHDRWETTTPAADASFLRTSSSVAAFGFDTSVLVLDLQTGASLWSEPITEEGKATHPIAVDDRHVYVSGDRTLRAHEARTGALVWSQPVGAASLAATEEGLFVRTDSHVVLSLDPATGATIWTTRTDDGRLSWGLVVGTTEGTLIIRNRAGAIVAYDTATGTERWSSMHGTATTPGTGPSTTRATVPTTIAPDDAFQYLSYGDGFVVTTGRDGLFLIDAVTGDVVDRGKGVESDRASLGDGHLAYIDQYYGDVAISALPR